MPKKILFLARNQVFEGFWPRKIPGNTDFWAKKILFLAKKSIFEGIWPRITSRNTDLGQEKENLVSLTVFLGKTPSKEKLPSRPSAHPWQLCHP